MKKIDWAQKLSSRKFWAALTGLISSLLVFFKVPDNEIAQISSIVGAIGVLAIYILAEAHVDASRSENEGVIANIDTVNTLEVGKKESK